tara:strand:- start:173 stop:1318 length:1146 start_codon:yes stop_codon:yes gene_type:complete
MLVVGTAVGGRRVESKILVTNRVEIIISAQGDALRQSLFDKAAHQSKKVAITTKYVEINVENLAGYIEATKKETNQNGTLERNVETACLILQLARSSKDNTIPMFTWSSNYGREYQKGLSLQTTPSIVRQAALGPTVTEIDISNCVFTWMYNAVDEHTRCDLEVLPAYLLRKRKVRKQLAFAAYGHLPNYNEATSINTIKQVLTSLGFGARLNKGNCCYKDETNNYKKQAFAEIVTSPAIRAIIIEHPFVASLLKELNVMKKNIIAKHYDMLFAHTELRTPKNKLSSSHAMAWLYQHAEKDIMDKMTKDLNLDVLLSVHDGIYVTNPVTGSTVNDWISKEWLLGKADVILISKQKVTANGTTTSTVRNNVQPAIINTRKLK